jgi:hypothetical protein
VGRAGNDWRLLAAPTPGEANAAPAALGPVPALRINEWMASPVEGDDWFELYNPGDQPVDLAGLFLTDNPSMNGRTNTRVAPLSFIAPRGWVVWQADGHPGLGRDHAGFSLDGEGETIQVYGPDLTLIDAVDFGLQIPGVSEGRLPDGGEISQAFPGTPTPGQANRLAGADTDDDGLPDDWELANGTDRHVPDADADPDDDGMTNREEYLAGTHPGQAASALRFEPPELTPAGLVLRFRAVAGHTYTVQGREDLAAGDWLNLHTQPADVTGQIVTLTNAPAAGHSYFRLVTP